MKNLIIDVTLMNMYELSEGTLIKSPSLLEEYKIDGENIINITVRVPEFRGALNRQAVKQIVADYVIRCKKNYKQLVKNRKKYDAKYGWSSEELKPFGYYKANGNWNNIEGRIEKLEKMKILSWSVVEIYK